MAKLTIEVMRELLNSYVIDFNRFSQSAVIIIATVYIIIMILAGVLNGTLLYIFITQRKLRKSSNLVLSSLLWNSLILLLIVLPIQLMQLLLKPVRANVDLAAIHSYLTFCYIWLNFSNVMHIALSRARNIKKNPGSKSYKMDIILLATAPVWSIVIPLLIFLVYSYKGMKAVLIFTFVEFSLMTCTVALSYGFIIHTVKKSIRKLKQFHQTNHSLRQQERTLNKVKHTVSVVIGGYLVVFIPFLCLYAIEVYNFHDEDFRQRNQLFQHIFLAVGGIILYLSSIINPVTYFYTQKDFRKEIRRFSVFQHIAIKMKLFKAPPLDE